MTKKRRMMQIPEDTEAFRYLYEGKNGNSKAKWKIVEEVISTIPKSKQHRAFKAYGVFVDEMEILYPGSKESLLTGQLNLWMFIVRRIIKAPDDGVPIINDAYFEELKKL